jgi:hypothetical protein
MDGSFNMFLTSMTALLCTPTELYTHHYVRPEDLPRLFTASPTTHITVIMLLTIMMCRCAI